MKCPVCTDTTLLMSEKQGVEIDYCPNCRGVWLDRGELDKLIQLSVSQQVQNAPPPPVTPAPQQREAYYPDRDKYQHGNYRKKSWLHEIFD